ncbi:MAG: S1 RNA-binding domain-containing protein, partial [Gemmatimonadaceae bacterium]
FIELEPGIEGLVHISEMSWTRNVRHPSKIVSIGESIEAVVLKVDPNEEKISLGMKQTEQDPWMVLPLKYPVGTRLSGKVRNLTSFGAFVEIEPGIDGLIHISDMSWTKRVQHPSEMVQIGQTLQVKILDIDWERERISLGLKQLQPYPWKDVIEKYPVGTRVAGKVVSITNYGAFIELEPGIEGLVHISEMSWTRNVRHPSKIVSIGESIEAVVLKVDPNEEKISLGMKQTEQDPWMVLPLKYPVGTRLSGKVRNLTSFGAFVEIEPGIDGLIHISDMSWTKRVQHPSEVVKKGDTVDVVILNIDAENKRISLGLKQATEDPWLRIGETYPVGTDLRGTVVRLMEKGVVVDIGNDIEGFVPLSHLPLDTPVNSPADICWEGMFLDLRIVEVDPIHRRIVLSVTNIPEEQPPKPETPSKIHSEEGDIVGAEIPADAHADAQMDDGQ